MNRVSLYRIEFLFVIFIKILAASFEAYFESFLLVKDAKYISFADCNKLLYKIIICQFLLISQHYFSIILLNIVISKLFYLVILFFKIMQ